MCSHTSSFRTDRKFVGRGGEKLTWVSLGAGAELGPRIHMHGTPRGQLLREVAGIEDALHRLEARPIDGGCARNRCQQVCRRQGPRTPAPDTVFPMRVRDATEADSRVIAEIYVESRPASLAE
jgi:hypothetical protein